MKLGLGGYLGLTLNGIICKALSFSIMTNLTGYSYLSLHYLRCSGIVKLWRINMAIFHWIIQVLVLMITTEWCIYAFSSEKAMEGKIYICPSLSQYLCRSKPGYWKFQLKSSVGRELRKSNASKSFDKPVETATHLSLELPSSTRFAWVKNSGFRLIIGIFLWECSLVSFT